MSPTHSITGIVALGAAGIAASILLHHLIRRPFLDIRVRLRLLMGLGVLPSIAALATTVDGMTKTTQRDFCGSCHVMSAHLDDAVDPESNSLAARHTRNHFTGEKSCYVCHANYGMLGYPLTKLNGMKHVYYYYLGGYGEMPLEKALDEIHLNEAYPNSNCMQCHSGGLASWKNVREHTALMDDLLTNKVACASAGCHGYSHPFSKKGDVKKLEATR
jgi:cytochrome c-type protein NapC